MIPHNKPTLGAREILKSIKVLRSGLLTTGEETSLFEKELSNFLNVPSSVAVSSGTSSLYLALWSLNAKNKSVAIPVYACSALRNAVKMAGANVVYVDNEYNSPNMDIDKLNSICPDIVIIPHMYGIPANVKKIKKEIFVIEDCAQSIGASIDGRLVGTFGHLGVFSFYSTKIITSGGHGGAIVSRDNDILQKIRDYREFDSKKDSKTRFNFKISDIQSGIGRIQLKKINSFIKKREKIFQKYNSQGWDLLKSSDPSIMPVRYRAVLRSDFSNSMIDFLNTNGIKSINPLNGWEVLSSDRKKYPNAHSLSDLTVSLPIYPSLTNSQASFIIKKVNKFLKKGKVK
jgi:perosamine synthetase